MSEIIEHIQREAELRLEIARLQTQLEDARKEISRYSRAIENAAKFRRIASQQTQDIIDLRARISMLERDARQRKDT